MTTHPSALSMPTLTPEPTPGSGMGAATEPAHAPGHGSDVGFGFAINSAPDVAFDPVTTTGQALTRAARDDYPAWLAHVAPVGECTHPIRLTGHVDTIDPATGALLRRAHTADMPDQAIYTACGNRRATVCPACAQIYRADTYHLISSGITGGKGTPATVRQHPFAFVTLTAPSFGLVHTTRAKNGRPRPCRPRRNPQTCPHGTVLACATTHHAGDPALGRPLCLDCYQHDHQVVWNAMSGELWRRTTATLAKHLGRLGARASFGKVAEMQARGVVHFHAIIRLDNLTPNLITTTAAGDLTEVPAPPPADVDIHTLHELLTAAVTGTRFDSPPHADRPEGWPIAWGPQLDVRPVQATTRQEIGTGPIAETAVAGYLAKYATKATEQTGHASARLTTQTVTSYADATTHVGRLIAACWRLGRPGADLDPAAATKNSGRLAYTRLRRWAHMLGFGGHFSTKSRRYSTTLTALRTARVTWRRNHAHRLAEHLTDNDTTLIVGTLTYAGTGWHTTGDALLATTAAVQARERRQAGRDELAHHLGTRRNPASIAA
jgi:hypothetical protein